jgi:hypothetical protein
MDVECMFVAGRQYDRLFRLEGAELSRRQAAYMRNRQHSSSSKASSKNVVAAPAVSPVPPGTAAVSSSVSRHVFVAAASTSAQPVASTAWPLAESDLPGGSASSSTPRRVDSVEDRLDLGLDLSLDFDDWEFYTHSFPELSDLPLDDFTDGARSTSVATGAAPSPGTCGASAATGPVDFPISQTSPADHCAASASADVGL